MEGSFSKTKSVTDLLARPPAAIAVAVSGGPDSMALLYLLSQTLDGVQIHALTFDHYLRSESAQEAAQIGAWVSGWKNVTHHILTWVGAKPDTGVMEAARDARYAALCAWCVERGIETLWLGHHRTDQAETFLFRLAKGSGLDGLGGMGETQPCPADGRVILARPLLPWGKDDIVAFCAAKNIPHVTDPSNENMKYARARLRQALPALEAEGLSEQRLAATARRLDRARAALDHYADRIIADHAAITPGRITIDLAAMTDAPEEMRIRVLRRLLSRSDGGYGPRLDRLEDCIDRVFKDGEKRFTLGGFVFTADRKGGVFLVERE